MTPVESTFEATCFDNYMAYLRHTATYVEKLYSWRRRADLAGQGSADSRQFTAERPRSRRKHAAGHDLHRLG